MLFYLKSYAWHIPKSRINKQDVPSNVTYRAQMIWRPVSWVDLICEPGWHHFGWRCWDGRECWPQSSYTFQDLPWIIVLYVDILVFLPIQYLILTCKHLYTTDTTSNLMPYYSRSLSTCFAWDINLDTTHQKLTCRPAWAALPIILPGHTCWYSSFTTDRSGDSFPYQYWRLR